MIATSIYDDYFEWMYDIVCKDRYEGDISYRKLLSHLHDIEFRYIFQKDSNRAEDGCDLRWRYSYRCNVSGVDDYITGPCSVLEMLVGLAIRCEETIMDDPAYGDRTAQWFWKMITSLGLGGMTDDNYDKKYVDDVIERFMNREYDADGRGGLFTIKDSQYDMRKIEIWTQLCYYLDGFT